MKKDIIARAEAELSAAYRGVVAPEFSGGWQAGVMCAVRQAALTGEEEKYEAGVFRIMWKFSLASVAGALACVALYAYAGGGSSSSTLSYSSNYESIESAIAVVAKL